MLRDSVKSGRASNSSIRFQRPGDHFQRFGLVADPLLGEEIPRQ